jgi:eukaryotic-like serine/threonine-protein kinase
MYGRDAMRESIKREEELFSAALAIPPEERAAFLRRACGEDQELSERVQSLLVNADSAAAFIDSQLWLYGKSPPPLNVPDDQRFGPYTLLHTIGEGGCSEVFLAEQTTPVRRQVALKIIKLGMDTKAVISRFSAEQQVLALMDHPNIAKVLDAGATPTGRPYFAMELVRGITITKYCDQARLSIEERLELFIQVCHAVQHAHQKGIVHRDIKPTNVLVTLHDGVPMVKVIDFGIAKATQGKLINQTVFTALDQFIGTPAYVSPEQLDSDLGDVDCRSDIYSLGVLLYELLAGCTAFEMPAASAGGLNEFRRRVCSEEPPVPSKRLRALPAEALLATARCRQSTASRLIERATGDLDWIVMRCLEKAQERRYSSADELATELQRFLRHEPVRARPPSMIYSLRKLARRHRLLFTAVTSVVFVLMLATVVSTWLAVRAYRAEQLVRTEVITQEAMSSFLRNDVLAQASPENEPDRDLRVRTALDRAANRIQGRFAGQPLVEAAIRTTLAESYASLGEYAVSETHFQRALWLNRRYLGESHRNTLYVARKIVGVLTDQGLYQKAQALGRQTLAIHEQYLGAGHAETLEAMYSFAVPLFMKGERPAATQLLEKTLEGYKRTFGPDHLKTLKVMDQLSEFYLIENQPAKGRELLLRALKSRKALQGDFHPDTINEISNLAGAYADMGEYAAAEPLMIQALQLRTRVLGADHPFTLSSLNNLATLYADEGKYAESARLQERAIELGVRKLGADHPSVLTWSNNLGMTYLDEDKLEEAHQVLERTFKLRQKILGPEHPKTLISMNNLGLVEHRRGRLSLAEKTLARAWAIGERVQGLADPDHLLIGERLAAVWVDQKKFSEAESLLRTIVDARRKHFPDEWRTYATLADLGRVLAALDRYNEAEPLLTSAYRELTLRTQRIPDNQKKVLKSTSDSIERVHARIAAR